MARWHVGTIGFSYPDWDGPFYPRGLRPSDRLAYYAGRFNAIELDTTFYALPSPDRVDTWAAAVPDAFRFVLKAPQVATHGDDDEEAFRAFVGLARRMGPKLGALLLQFPPGFARGRRDWVQRLLDLAQELPVAVEFRHDSWWRSDTEAWLRERQVTWVAADLAPVGHAGWPPDDPRAFAYRPFPFRDTGPFVYLRWCGRHGQYGSDGQELVDVTPRVGWWLQAAAEALTGDRPVFGFFGNSFAGHAPASAARLLELLGRPRPELGQPPLF